MADDQAVPGAPEGTRLALIEAGFALFGTEGFAATSTRALAARAGTNVASIAYHFGGKDGLRMACADEFVRRVSAVFAAVPVSDGLSAAAARGQMHAALQGVGSFLLGSGGGGKMVGFMLRELAEDGATVRTVYARLIAPAHEELCRIWGHATGQNASSAAVRLRVFSLVGQMIYFRIGTPVVARRMGWTDIGTAEVDEIMGVLHANLDAMLDDAGRKGAT